MRDLYWLKERLALVLVTLFFAWPPLHIALARQYLLDPWKLGAWGMYSTLPNQTDVQVFIYDAQGEIVANQNKLSSKHWDMYQRFKRRRDLIGELASPDLLGKSLLYLHPGAERVEIRVGVVQFDRQSKFLKLHAKTYEYKR